MKIAFVGKGGSGKSTVSTAFFSFIAGKGRRILGVDADINLHFSSHLAPDLKGDKYLSAEGNPTKIRSYLQGTNERIKHPDEMLKTTPPGSGSRLLSIQNDQPLLEQFAASTGDNGWIMAVGTYGELEIGVSCFHTNLAIFETLLSHTVTDKDSALVADMTAGTDAFAGSLHAQFDLIVLVVEPTEESVSVWDQYAALADAAGISALLTVVGNKVEDAEDEIYLHARIGSSFIGSLPYVKDIKRARQNGSRFPLEQEDPVIALFNTIEALAEKNAVASTSDRLQRLHKLHQIHCKEAYIVNMFGDLSGQIDPLFTYPGQNA